MDQETNKFDQYAARLAPLLGWAPLKETPCHKAFGACTGCSACGYKPFSYDDSHVDEVVVHA